jgi:hypothetical protein
MLPSGIMSQHDRTINIKSPSDTGKDPLQIVIQVSAMTINLFKRYSKSYYLFGMYKHNSKRIVSRGDYMASVRLNNASRPVVCGFLSL